MLLPTEIATSLISIVFLKKTFQIPYRVLITISFIIFIIKIISISLEIEIIVSLSIVTTDLIVLHNSVRQRLKT